jgi:hypothetical protein
MEPLLHRGFAFDICGNQEVPSNPSTAIGSAIVTTNRLNSHLDYIFIVDGLSGPATAAHIHEAPAGMSGGVLLAVDVPGPVSSGQAEITGDIVLKLESGDTYLNVHTAGSPETVLR